MLQDSSSINFVVPASISCRLKETIVQPVVPEQAGTQSDHPCEARNQNKNMDVCFAQYNWTGYPPARV
jgi:hypothetical protein